MMMNIQSKELTQPTSSLLRTYKDSVFRMLFNCEENVLELYNALTGASTGPATGGRKN